MFLCELEHTPIDPQRKTFVLAIIILLWWNNVSHAYSVARQFMLRLPLMINGQRDQGYKSAAKLAISLLRVMADSKT